MEKIVILVNSLARGGAEHVTTILANYLNNRNYECTIVTERICDKEYTITPETKRISLNDISKKKQNILINIIKLLTNIIKLRNILKKIQPDVMLIMDVPCCMSGIPASRGLNIKTIVSERNDPKHFSGKNIVKNIARHLMKKADGYVFQTKDAMDFYEKILNKKGVIIENPLLVDELPNPKINYNKNIVSVGRLSKQKNQEILIKSFSRIIQKYGYDYKLYIYGDGPLRKKLEDLVDDLKIRKNVFLPGNIQNVIEKINGSYMFIMTSNYEGMPNALIEAMSLGIPCISTDCPCGGPKSLIEHKKNGLLFEVNNIDELTDMIELYINNDQIRKDNGNNALYVREKLDAQKICEKWVDYFKSI